MFSIAFAVVRNAQDAEDAVQETFLKLYRGKAWLGMRDEKAFLARSVWRTALDRLSARGPLALGLDELQVATSGESPEGNALALQFTLDASRIKQMVKSKAADGSPMDEPLITQRTVQLTVRLPLNKTETVFDSSTHAMKPLGPVGLKPGEGGPAPAMGEDVPLVIEMTATELL